MTIVRAHAAWNELARPVWIRATTQKSRARSSLAISERTERAYEYLYTFDRFHAPKEKIESAIKGENSTTYNSK